MPTTRDPDQRAAIATRAGPTFKHVTAVRGTFRSPKGKVGTMSGWLRLDRFILVADGLRAAGVFTGELIDADGTLVGVGSCRRAVPATISRGAGGIVAAIGPVDVELLGLVVTVDRFSVEARVPVRAKEGGRVHEHPKVVPLRAPRSRASRRADR